MAQPQRAQLIHRAFEARGAARLGRASRLGIHAVGAGLWVSGGSWLLFHHYLRREGALGLTPHPIEPWLLPLHGALALTGVWVLGVLWRLHFVPGWSSGNRRRSGGAVVGILAVLILSGYLLYYTGHEQLRAVISLVHWSVGLAVPLVYVVHRRARRRRRARAEAGTT